MDPNAAYAPAVRAKGLAHIPELDGVRGIAILLVLLFHSAKHLVGFGWMGVDIFFVLSGFLITSGLLHTVQEPRYLRNFYTKRALRIWPLYYLLLAYVFVVVPVLHPAGPAHGFEWVSYAFYAQNLVHPLSAPAELGPTWSLAIEEHFYLVWPFVVLFVSRRGLEKFGFLLIVAAPLARAILIVAGAPSWTVYYVTPCRLDALALGALLALYVFEGGASLDLVRRFAAPVTVVCAAIAIPLALWIGSDAVNGTLPLRHPSIRVLLLSITAMAGAGLVGRTVTASGGGSMRLLRASWLRYIGKISYGVYLIHEAVFDAVGRRFTHAGAQAETPLTKLVRALCGIGLTLIVATICWYALERPILRLKARLTS